MLVFSLFLISRWPTYLWKLQFFFFFILSKSHFSRWLTYLWEIRRILALVSFLQATYLFIKNMKVFQDWFHLFRWPTHLRKIRRFFNTGLISQRNLPICEKLESFSTWFYFSRWLTRLWITCKFCNIGLISLSNLLVCEKYKYIFFLSLALFLQVTYLFVKNMKVFQQWSYFSRWPTRL